MKIKHNEYDENRQHRGFKSNHYKKGNNRPQNITRAFKDLARNIKAEINFEVFKISI